MSRRLLALVAGAALGLSGCSAWGGRSALAPASPEAQAISNLFLAMLVIAAGIIVFVVGMLLYVAWRFRAPPGGSRDPVPLRGGSRLEFAWTITPAIVLAGVYVLMIPAFLNLPTPRTPPLDALAIGHQFWWEFRYPSLNVLTANELHIPTDTDVRVQLQSADVIHSFWIPRLAGKQDLVPGKTNEVYLYAREAGTYLGQCAEFCGLQHAWMLLRVVAEPRAAFDQWATAQAAPAGAPADATAQRGQQVFLAQTCINCHAVGGTAATAGIGPDLTHVGSRATLAAGALDNTRANLERWLIDPQAVKPGANMPAFGLPREDMAALAAYLEGLK